MCGPTFIHPPPSPPMRNRDTRRSEKTLRKNQEKERAKETHLHSQLFIFLWHNYMCNWLKMLSCPWRGLLRYPHLSSMLPQLTRIEVPCQLKLLIHKQPRPISGGADCKNDGDFLDAVTKKLKKSPSPQLKAQSHTLIWILKLSRCLGDSNSSFCKTVIMTNVCISTFPNPPSMSLAWGSAAGKLTEMDNVRLPTGNGSKTGTRINSC